MKRWSWWEMLLFSVFLFWSAAGVVFSAKHITPADVQSWSLTPWLVDFIVGCIHHGDPILIFLAFANTHAQAARQWDPARARRWALIIVSSALVIETMGVTTGLIFGDYHYTEHFGPMLWVVPLTIPLAWYIVVTNALFIVRLAAPHCSQIAEAALSAIICTLYDFILEPFATTSKHYWVWQDGAIPLRNYVAWFILSGLLVWLFAPRFSTAFPRDVRPIAILAITLLLFFIR